MLAPRPPAHLLVMGRMLRPRAPGVPFHVTARIQWRKPLLSGMEAVAMQVIDDSRDVTDAAVAAHAIMPNHLHLLVIQGSFPLSALMQPLLRRLALAVQRHTGRDGHVFERRFTHKMCMDPDYLRNAIAYIHLNAARKGFCTGADDFEWCSHSAYRAVATADLATRAGAMTAMMMRMF